MRVKEYVMFEINNYLNLISRRTSMELAFETGVLSDYLSITKDARKSTRTQLGLSWHFPDNTESGFYMLRSGRGIRYDPSNSSTPYAIYSKDIGDVPIKPVNKKALYFYSPKLGKFVFRKRATAYIPKYHAQLKKLICDKGQDAINKTGMHRMELDRIKTVRDIEYLFRFLEKLS